MIPTLVREARTRALEGDLLSTREFDPVRAVDVLGPGEEHNIMKRRVFRRLP